MAAVVAMDRAGRIVIPKDVREAQGIIPGTKFRLETFGRVVICSSTTPTLM